MFQWTDGEVSHVVKLALESLRSENQSFAASQRSRLIEALASELSAAAWHAHTLEAQSLEAQSLEAQSLEAQSLEAEALETRLGQAGQNAGELLEGAALERATLAPGALPRAQHWACKSAALVSEGGGPEFSPAQRYAPQLQRLLDRARASGAAAEETLHRSVDLPQADEQSVQQSQHALVWLAVQPEGTCACVEFLKRPGDGPFTTRDEAVLRILSPELLADPAGMLSITNRSDAGASPASGAVSQGDEPAETIELAELPRRQREVLERLLSGASVKEIASELGISPYTVNDYIKALYRRYRVSSRGELMAAAHGLRRPAVPK